MKIPFSRYLGLFLAGFLLIQPTFADPPLPEPVGRVVWVKGVLKAIMPNKEERTLQKTSLIYLHDTLTTDKVTQAGVVFSDNTLMTFREGTSFSIDQYSFSPKSKTKSAGKFVMNLIEGGFRTITGVIAKNAPDYQINTPIATIGVRGTDYAVIMDKEKGQMYAAYYTGQPCVTNKFGEVCLGPLNKYAQVSPNSAPVLTNEKPAVFNEKLEIVSAKIAPFSQGGGPGGGRHKYDSVLTNFCIQ